MCCTVHDDWRGDRGRRVRDDGSKDNSWMRTNFGGFWKCKTEQPEGDKCFTLILVPEAAGNSIALGCTNYIYIYIYIRNTTHQTGRHFGRVIAASQRRHRGQPSVRVHHAGLQARPADDDDRTVPWRAPAVECGRGVRLSRAPRRDGFCCRRRRRRRRDKARATAAHGRRRYGRQTDSCCCWCCSSAGPLCRGARAMLLFFFFIRDRSRSLACNTTRLAWRRRTIQGVAFDRRRGWGRGTVTAGTAAGKGGKKKINEINHVFRSPLGGVGWGRAHEVWKPLYP